MLVAALPSLVLAYNANQPLGALREPERAEVGFAEQAAEERAARLNQRFFRTGSPVPHGWRPRPEKLSRAPKKRASVAQITEEQAYPEATITYVTPAMTSQFVRFGMHAQAAALSFRRLSHKQTPPEGSEAWTAARKMPDQAPSDSWAAAEAKAKDEVRWEADAINRDAAEERARQYMAGEDNRRPLGIEKLRVGSKTGLSRCGFSWDDAAVKMGDWCFGTVSTCIAPPGTVDNPESYWFGQNYSCFADLPDIGVRGGGRTCVPKTDAVSAGWCTQFCNTADTFCDPIFCDCTDRGTGLEDMAPFKVPDTFNLSAPVQPPRENLTRTLEQLPPRNHALVAKAIKAAEEQLGGLPDCTWRPGKSCSNTSQYECLQGKHAGECSKSNWFDQPASMCKASCVHTSLLTPAPYYALWYPGPLAKEFHPGEEQPRYHHQPERLSLQARNINLRKSDVMMSDMCKSSDNHFVGISLYSPKYKAKAERLLASCARVGVCCKGTLLPSGAFGPQAPEGSEAYRFETIAMKPSFILSQLEATELPVVFLDTDLEFRKFPQLFVPGSWPNGGRDLAIFNYWGNETDWKHAATPTTGSGVVFVNHTRRGRAVLTAWAEAMAYPGNERAPDDQVLDKLLNEGGWLARASFGWLPSSYMRTMPAYYRGVDPVIEHDHGNMPGLLKHSESKPRLPKVLYTEPCDPGHDDPGWPRLPAPRPRSYENVAEMTEPPMPDGDFQMPTGTCKATNPDADWDNDTQLQNNLWCDRSCVPIPWGGLGEDACSEGHDQTGQMHCVCIKGIAPVTVSGGKPAPLLELPPSPPPNPPRPPPVGEEGSDDARGGLQKNRQKAPQQQEAAAEAAMPGGGPCEATNPELDREPQAKSQWAEWCEQNCKPPAGAPENCLTPEATGSAMCVC